LLAANESQSAKSPARRSRFEFVGIHKKMPRNVVFTTSDGGAVLGENGEIAE
jgi:hypothetical protein